MNEKFNRLLCAFPTVVLRDKDSNPLFPQVDLEVRDIVIKAILTDSVISAFNLAFERNQIELEE